jgi:hypothetical protein
MQRFAQGIDPPGVKLLQRFSPPHVLGMPKAMRDQTGKGLAILLKSLFLKDEAVRIACSI